MNPLTCSSELVKAANESSLFFLSLLETQVWRKKGATGSQLF